MRHLLYVVCACAGLLLAGCNEVRISHRGDRDGLPPTAPPRNSPRNNPRANPPDHAPAHGVRKKHGYYYYPRSEVYYAPDRELYFWLEVGKWRIGANLPTRIFVDINDAIHIELETDAPYERHDEISKKYKNRGKGKGKGRGRGRGNGQGQGRMHDEDDDDHDE